MIWWDDFPPRLSGQTKTVWRWLMKVGDNQWLTDRVPGDYTKVEWLKLSEKTDQPTPGNWPAPVNKHPASAGSGRMMMR
ncbi:MAG: hypothetical protein KDB90_02010 [Planctomycetes bacterium]|nr:hypothetical protein [Planctomycetota bacterium]